MGNFRNYLPFETHVTKIVFHFTRISISSHDKFITNKLIKNERCNFTIQNTTQVQRTEKYFEAERYHDRFPSNQNRKIISACGYTFHISVSVAMWKCFQKPVSIIRSWTFVFLLSYDVRPGVWKRGKKK